MKETFKDNLVKPVHICEHAWVNIGFFLKCEEESKALRYREQRSCGG